MDLPTIDSLVSTVRHAANYSGVHEAFRNLPNYETKEADGTPVTELDRNIQAGVFNKMRREGLYLIGEEDGSEVSGDAKYALAIDPLDGTDAYVRGIPTSACAVTILEKRDDLWFPIMAVIHELTKDGFTWSATAGSKTTMKRDVRFRGDQCVIPEAAAPYRVTVSSWPGAPFGLHEVASNLDYAVLRNQAFGSIALGAGLIACGGTHATVFPGTSALETVAMTLIVRGAGGVATDIYGNDFDGFELGTDKSGKPDFLLPNGAIMAANRELADQLSSLITSRM